MNRIMDILEYLKIKRLLADGAFGTYYAALTGDEQAVPEEANLLRPDLVKQIHLEYLHAGARLLRTNTFAANSGVLRSDRKKQRQIIKEGYRLAQEAREEFLKAHPEEMVFLAADIGPIKEDFEEENPGKKEEYQFFCDVFLECGADLILFETFSDVSYIKPLAAYIKAKNNRCEVMAMFCLDRYGYSKEGICASRLLNEADQVEGLDIIGFNCGIGPGHLLNILKHIDLNTKKRLSIMPNSSYPEKIRDRAVYLQNDQYFAKCMADIASLGIDVIGGCCGTTPEYIKKTKKELETIKPIKKKDLFIKSSEEKAREPKKNELFEKIKSGKKVIAVELDPPYDAQFDGILERAHALKSLGVDLITFADSPMARPRVDSILTSVKVRSEVDICVMPHISCRDKNRIAVRGQLLGAYINGLRNVLVVTGDPIPGSERGINKSVFDFNSIRLMEYIHEMNREHFLEDPIIYGGALNYGRANLEAEIRRMKKKIQAGASYFLTQPIFSKEDIERISYIKTQVDTKILCGIMPLVTYRNARFVQNEIAGIHVPDEIVESFTDEMTKKEAQQNGVRIAEAIIKALDPIADGYYFMLPFNRISLVQDILQNRTKLANRQRTGG